MDRHKQEKRSLIMCTTPLQMLIAEKIIELNSDKKFDLLVLVSNDNNKYAYYYSRLKEKCFNSLYCVSDLKINNFFSFIKQLKKNNLNKKYQELYLASIDSRYLQYVVSKNNLSHIYTFDDGTANIIRSSLYYSDNQLSKFKKSIWRILGLKYYMREIKEKTQFHYTLYENVPNIIKKTKFLSLLPRVKFDSLNKNKIIKFYLGQPLTEIDEKFNHAFVESKLKKLKVDYYYPHPREKIYPKGDFRVVESSLIFEDYIVQFLIENPNLKVEVYSFISTALLNIVGLKQVSVVYIYDDYLYQLHQNFYNLVERDFNIPHLNLG